jgi:hypothetical protein
MSNPNPFAVNLGIPIQATSVILDQLALQTKYGTDPGMIGQLCIHAPKCATCGQESYRNQANDVWCANLACKDNTGDLSHPPAR